MDSIGMFVVTDEDWARLVTRLQQEVPEDPMSCWIWMGSVSSGYGQIKIGGKTRRTHRAAWIYFRGDLPADLSIDHLCQNKLCCNPYHMDPCPKEINVKRAPTYWSNRLVCPLGHPLDGAGRTRRGTARRWCKTCNRESMRKRRGAA